MSELRAFIAIELSNDVQASLRQAGGELENSLASGTVRWVKPENIHLTLRFLGNVRESKLTEIYGGLDQITGTEKPFSLQLDLLGCFPNPKKPRVIWIGLNGDVEQLDSLQNSVGLKLHRLGWEEEKRKYHPHLTLGRVKDVRKVLEADLPWGRVLVEGLIEVKAIHLIESQLLASGAVYSTRHSSYLGG